MFPGTFKTLWSNAVDYADCCRAGGDVYRNFDQLPFCQIKAFYYSMISLFFGVGMLQAIESMGKLTGVLQALRQFPLIQFGFESPYYYCFLALTLISLFILYRFEVSRIGWNLKAIDQSY